MKGNANGYIFIIFVLQFLYLANANGLENVLKQWLEQIRVQKPIKCNYNRNLYRKAIGRFAEVKDNHIIRSFKCNYPNQFKSYSFKGKVKDGVIDGPGKLKTYIDINDMDFSTDETVCFNLRKFRRSDIKSIVGTWNNGFLEGPAKIVLANNSTLVANFKSGLLNGLRRDFHPNGDIDGISLFENGRALTGPTWYFHKKSLIFQYSTVDRDFPVDAININLTSKEYYKGYYYPNVPTFLPTRTVEITRVSSNDCFPSLEWHELGQIVQKKQPLCQMFKDEAVTETTRLRKIWRHLSNTTRLDNEDTPSDIIWNLNPLKEMPSDKCFKFINNCALELDFNSAEATVLGVDNVHLTIDIGSVDDHGKLHGFVTMTVKGDLKPSDKTLGWTIQRIASFFNHGVPVGIVHIQSLDMREISVNIENGCFHGPVIINGVVPILPGVKLIKNAFQGIGYLGYYKNGYLSGAFWQGMVGGGLLHGTIQESDHKMSGDHISYIYPDYNTMLHGTFEDKVMKSAREAALQEIGCDENGSGLPIVTKFKFNSTDPNDVTFYYESVTNASFGGGIPDILDPFERKHLQLGKSKVSGGGEGVFAKTDFEADGSYQLISIYAGFRYNDEQRLEYRTKYCFNTSKTDDERRHCSKYTLTACGYTYEIPPEIDKPNNFHPSLGPKVNHNFVEYNSDYNCFEHPRFGLIGGVFKPGHFKIKAGQELFTFYGYAKNDFPFDYPWYFKLENEIKG